ncbi:MAG: RluA family pseudouridine synthase [Planctomycetota bacterium]|nr:MAG: RluA family pseudouridine synthase [Planctomycetota bacterium]
MPKPGPRSRSAQRRPRHANSNPKQQRRGSAAVRPAPYRPGPDARVVSAPEAGSDLGHYLKDNLPGTLSIRAIRRMLAAGHVTVNGQLETFGSRRVRKGDVVDVRMPQAAEQTRTRYESKRLIYDDFDLLAYDKPAGLAVTPTEDGKQWHILKLLGDALECQVFPVHRIDADTSGLVILGRTPQRAEEASTWFRDHQVHKTYHAIVRGHPKEEGERRTYLVIKDQQPGFEKWGTGRGPDAREAITRWRVIERLGDYASLVEVTPATGRHHQIRIHFAEMGHPLYGDRVYGDRRDPILTRRHMLHAIHMRLPHDGRGKPLNLRCPLPADMKALMKELRSLKDR